MPKGRQDQKMLANSIGASVMVAQIATGESEDNIKSGRVQSGKAARASSLSSEERSNMAKNC